jgi:MFS family permease
MSMLDLNTVFPTLINALSANKYIFGAMYSIMLGTPLLFNILFSHYLKKKVKTKPFLLIGMYLRSFSLFLMGVLTYYFTTTHPTLVLASFFILIFVFSISGGFAGLAYSDLIAKTVPTKQRTTVYTFKQFFGAISSLLGGFVIMHIFSNNIPFPNNYALSLTIGFIGLIIASAGFYLVKEPENNITPSNEKFGAFLKRIPSIFKKDNSFKYFVIMENLSSFGVMILPFYILYAKDVLQVENSYIGLYLIYQISGTIISNILWGYIGAKLSAKSIIKICLVLGASLPILAILLGAISKDLYGILFFLMGVVISGRRIGFEPTLLNIIPDDKRIEYLGIRGTLNISIVLLPLIGATLIEILGYHFTFVTVTLFMLLAMILLKNVTEKQSISCL